MFKYILICTLFFSSFAMAKGSLSFSSQEIRDHKNYITTITGNAEQCLNNIWNEHVSFYNKWGVSKFYGSRNSKLKTYEQRIEALRQLGKPTYLVDQLKTIDCIGLAVKCLRAGFYSTGKSSLINVWNKLDHYVRLNGVSGVYLINGLRKLGWKVLYWNPYPALNAKWDREEPTLIKGKVVKWNSAVKNDEGQPIYDPSWGLHEYRYNSSKNRGRYYITPVDDAELLVNFKWWTPQSFSKYPFFIGTAHAGYHVFPGFNGNIIEAHSVRQLGAFNNLEKSVFNPLAMGGGPRWTKIEKYRSGVIAVPPGY